MIDARTVRTLKAASDDQLAKWWCILNRWEWPAELEGEERRDEYRGGRRREVMQFIQGQVGMRNCLAQWRRGLAD